MGLLAQLQASSPSALSSDCDNVVVELPADVPKSASLSRQRDAIGRQHF
jgi:hypothetical protein